MGWSGRLRPVERSKTTFAPSSYDTDKDPDRFGVESTLFSIAVGATAGCTRTEENTTAGYDQD